MKTPGAESGGVLIGALLISLLLAMLGGVAMNLAMTETSASARHMEEKNGLLLAESGVEQVVAWLTHGDLPLPGGAPAPDRFTGAADRPDVELDAARPDDNRAPADLGRIVRTRLYGPGLPGGFCTVEVTAESGSGVRRTVSLELGRVEIPPLEAAVYADSQPNALAHGGAITANRPPSPWQYQVFKDYARRFGSYYVPDREGRLYKDGRMAPSAALTPAEVFGSKTVGDQRGLVFIDTLDQERPAAENLATVLLDSPYMEGAFYVNAHVILRPQGRGETIPVNLTGVTIRGVLHASGTLRVEGQPRVFGAVAAERGLVGGGFLEVWYNADLGRGRIQGLPVVFPVRGTWREWGN